jgi:hypothetical protein
MPTTAAAIAATIAGAASVCSEWYRKLQPTAHTLSFLAGVLSSCFLSDNA